MSKQSPPAPPPTPEKLPPHSVQAEEALIGSILISPDMLSLVSFVKPDQFFIVRNSYVWKAFLDLQASNEPIDLVTVTEQLRSAERLDDVGGPARLTFLMNQTPTSIYAEAYAQLVVRAATRRRLLGAASEMAVLAYEENADVHEVMGRAQSALDGVTGDIPTPTLQPIYSAVSDYMDVVEDAGSRYLLKTGYTELDRLIGGLPSGSLTLLAARPGQGKTAWILTMLLYAARQLKETGDPGCIVLFSMEMYAEQIIERLISMETGIPVVTLRSGELTDTEWVLFLEAVAELSELPILIDERGTLTPTEVRTTCMRIAREYGPIRAVLVDYAQLMSVEPELSKRIRTEVEAHSHISRSLKLLSKQLGTPLLAAAQLSRKVEERQDKRPMPSDLRNSGTYEQDADVILFLYRDEVYNPNTERTNQAECILGKHRNGAQGTVNLFFRKERMQFVNLKKTDVDLAAFDSWTSYADIPTDEGVYDG